MSNSGYHTHHSSRSHYRKHQPTSFSSCSGDQWASAQMSFLKLLVIILDSMKQEPVVGVETYAELRKNLLLSRCALRQPRETRDWRIQADKWKQLAVPPEIVSSSLRSEFELQVRRSARLFTRYNSPLPREEWQMRARYPLWIWKPHV